jgi:UDP-2,3-diacylglucosamine pyrophosphatase LpxH
MKKIIIISDIHLNDWADNTNKQILQFLKALNKKKGWFDVMLLGDIFEGTQGINTKEDEDNYTKYYQDLFYCIREQWTDVFNELDQLVFNNNIWFINGNHDNSLLRYYSEVVTKNLVLNYVYDKQIVIDNILFTHGEMFDKFFKSNKINNIIDRFVKWYGGMERKLGLNKINVDNNAIHRMYGSSIEGEAKKYIEDKGYDGICMGHTHINKAEYNEVGKCWYINTGCWVYNNNIYTVYDRDRKTFNQYKYQGGDIII